MKLIKHYLTKNRCYIANNKMKPCGIVVHSTGANNPNLTRYVDDSSLGKVSSEHWNQSKTAVCVHGFIGKCADGSIAVVQTLPFDVKCWGCGSGPKGSYNNTHIQFEICEDALNDKKYFDAVYNAAVEFCAYICKECNIPVSAITTHCDAHKAGYASNHGDVMHWFPKFGKNMDGLRSAVSKKLNTSEYKVRVVKNGLAIRNGSNNTCKKIGEIKNNGVYTIVEVKGHYGLLKSGAGWINLRYTVRL